MGYDRAIPDLKDADERAFWLGKLSTGVTPSNLRLDYPRPDAYYGDRSAVELRLDASACRGLARLAKDDPLETYTALVATLAVCLRIYTERAEVVIGGPALPPHKERSDDCEQHR